MTQSVQRCVQRRDSFFVILTSSRRPPEALRAYLKIRLARAYRMQIRRRTSYIRDVIVNMCVCARMSVQRR